MTLHIKAVGPQAIIVAAPRTGHRHRGVPASGPADPLSAGLLNASVGNAPSAGLLECPYGGLTVRFGEDCLFAVGGAPAAVTLDGASVPDFTPCRARKGETLVIGAPAEGLRVYLAVAGGVLGEKVLGSETTYLPAALGGCQGRALRQGDRVGLGEIVAGPSVPVPERLHPFAEKGWVLRAVAGPELDAASDVFRNPLTIGRRADRMGLALEGRVAGGRTVRVTSGPVFCGTLQAPPGDTLFLLGPDAQTTGGYPRLLQVIRADRHRIGQLRPGDRISFQQVSAEDAREALRRKTEAIKEYVPSFTLPG